jgi:FdhD protein
LKEAVPQLERVPDGWKIPVPAIRAAREGLEAARTANEFSVGVHAAAWCSQDGAIEIVREDVGRHNALDKLLGALESIEHSDKGFVIVTSRASYEMVAKVVRQKGVLLAALSAPTTMAIQMADMSGLTLVANVKSDHHIVYTHAHRCH